jgi:hypothetical protein
MVIGAAIAQVLQQSSGRHAGRRLEPLIRAMLRIRRRR